MRLCRLLLYEPEVSGDDRYVDVFDMYCDQYTDVRWYMVPLAQDNEIAMFVGHYDGWFARHMLFAYQR